MPTVHSLALRLYSLKRRSCSVGFECDGWQASAADVQQLHPCSTQSFGQHAGRPAHELEAELAGAKNVIAGLEKGRKALEAKVERLTRVAALATLEDIGTAEAIRVEMLQQALTENDNLRARLDAMPHAQMCQAITLWKRGARGPCNCPKSEGWRPSE